MKKRVIWFIIIMVVVWASMAVSILFHYQNVKQIQARQNVPGTFDMPVGQDPFTEELLAGKWEYYPGVHYVSDGAPMDVAPILVEVPFNGDYLKEQSPARFEKNSYRLVVNNCEKFDFDGLIFMLPYLYTNFRVFFNGHERGFRLQNPYGYPVYNIIHTGDVEVVIETTGFGSTGLTSIPEMTSIRVAMLKSDTTKAAMGEFLAAMAVFFIVILLLSAVTKNIRTRNYIITSLVYIISFAVIMLWGLGIMDSVMSFLSLDLIKWIIFITSISGIALIFYMHRKSHPTAFSSRVCLLICGLLAGNLVCRMLFSWLGIWNYFSWITAAVFLICYILWMRRIFDLIKTNGWEIYILEIGVFALFAASAATLVNLYIFIPTLCDYVIPACILIYIATIIVMVLLYERKVTRQAELALTMEKDILKMETALFASRMNPHFIYNSLTTVQELCYTDPRKAASLIVRFSKFLRSNLDFLDNEELIPFSAELEFINNYIYIQKERFSEAMIYEEHIGYSDFHIPPFSIQPIIENAIKYGIRANDDQGVVSFSTFQEGGNIYIEVLSDGPEFQESDLRENHSVYIIRKRIENLCHGKLEIAYDKALRKSRVRIILPEEGGTK